MLIECNTALCHLQSIYRGVSNIREEEAEWRERERRTNKARWAGIGGPLFPGLTRMSVWIWFLNAASSPPRKPSLSFSSSSISFISFTHFSTLANPCVCSVHMIMVIRKKTHLHKYDLHFMFPFISEKLSSLLKRKKKTNYGNFYIDQRIA